jgi:hypothetical protein
MDTLICAGGSGTRVLESLLHLCAAGLGPKRLRTFIIDADATNGSVEKASKLVASYVACQKAFGEGPFFKTELDLLEGSPRLRVWSPVDRHQKFRQVLNYEGLSRDQREIADLLFTEEEFDTEMEVGFLGHPALGAAALSLLPLFRNDPKDPLWDQVATELHHDVNSGAANVMIAGSIFGGTGASAIHPLVRYLRSPDLLEANREKLKVGAVALTPYFMFSEADAAAKGIRKPDKTGAKSEDFPLASRSAAEYYEHLHTQHDWGFDAMYWIGDDDPAKVDYSRGGSDQNNPAHFVELLGALACRTFFGAPSANQEFFYSGPAENGNFRDRNIVSWLDLPLQGDDRKEVRDKIHRFHLAGMAHLGFFNPLLASSKLAERPYVIPWYRDYFANGAGALTSAAAIEDTNLLTEYFARSYFPWWEEIHRLGDRVQLLNQNVWMRGDAGEQYVMLDQLTAVLYEDRNRRSTYGMDIFFDWTVRVAVRSKGVAKPASRYFSILGDAAWEFVKQRNAGRGYR